MREVLQILNDEFRLSMALSGELMIASVSKSLIKRYFCPPSLPPQAAGTWRKSTGTSYSFLNSSSPAEGSTEQSSSANQTERLQEGSCLGEESMQLLEHSRPIGIHARVRE